MEVIFPMDGEKTIVYTYTNQPSAKSGNATLKWSDFVVTEGNASDTITKITGITIEYKRRHDIYYELSHSAKLVFGTGSTSTSITSDSVPKQSSKGVWHSITNTFSTMPSPSVFESVVQVQLLVSEYPGRTAWIASTSSPIKLTVTYISAAFYPSISNFELFRTNSNGVKSDTGEYLSYLADIKIQKMGTSGSGTMKLIYYDSSALTGGTEKNTESNITASTVSVTVSKTAATDLPIGSAGYYRLRFTYTGVLDNLRYMETVETPAIYIPRVFANVHLAKYQTGGVAFGGFSTSTLGNPKFESHYPARLYGNIAQIGGTPESDNVWRYLEEDLDATAVANSSLSTPGRYDGIEAGGGTLRCRAIENKRIIAGSIMVKATKDDLIIADLTEAVGTTEWAPSSNVFSINACQGARIARIGIGGRGSVNSGGESLEGKLFLSWVRKLSDGEVYRSEPIWVQCSIEYWID